MFHSPRALHSDFLFMNLFIFPYRSLVLIGNGFVSLASCATFRFFIYELVYLPVPQFGFNWKRLCFTRLVHYIPIFTYELILETSRSVSQFGFIKNGSVFLAYCDYITISSWTFFFLYQKGFYLNGSVSLTFMKYLDFCSFKDKIYLSKNSLTQTFKKSKCFFKKVCK